MNLVQVILESSTQLPPFPAVLQRVLQLLDNPNSSARAMVEVLQYDQAVTANVLRVCNSAFFSLRRPIHSLQEALMRIGFNQLLEIILSRGIGQFIAKAYPGYDLAEGQLWRHSVTCALLSEIVAERLQEEPSPTHFTAALLHDIGKVILSEFVKDHLQEIRRIVTEENLSFIEAEKRVLGVDHAELGGKIADQWQFPRVIVSAIRFHHTPLFASEDPEIAKRTYLCDMVAMLTGIGGGVDGLSYHAHKEVMKEYQLRGEDIEHFIVELNQRFKGVESLLNPV